MPKFEKIDELTDRLKVREGWVVRTRSTASRTSPGGIINVSTSVHTIFIKDKFHEWKLEE